MKSFFRILSKLLLHIFRFIIIIAILFIAYIFFVSKQNNTSLQDTLSYVQSVGTNIISPSNSKNSVEIILDENTNNSSNENNLISSTNSSIPIRYYYAQLDDTAKLIYSSLEKNIDNLKKNNYTINFSTKFNSLLNETNGRYKLNKSFQSALDAFFYDHPELFYIDLTKISISMKYISLAGKTTYSVSIVPGDNRNYLYSNFSSEAEVKSAISTVENIRKNLINSLPDTSTYNKLLKIHDTLVNSLDYKTTSSTDNSHNIYGALSEKKAVCEGYAKAFKYILDDLNIESILVGGEATNSSNKTEAHMWNYVKIDDSWYGVDVTWDDPVIIGSSSKKIIRHDYFMKGSSSFINSHTPSGQISDKGMIFSIPTLNRKDFPKK